MGDHASSLDDAAFDPWSIAVWPRWVPYVSRAKLRKWGISAMTSKIVGPASVKMRLSIRYAIAMWIAYRDLEHGVPVFDDLWYAFQEATRGGLPIDQQAVEKGWINPGIRPE